MQKRIIKPLFSILTILFGIGVLLCLTPSPSVSATSTVQFVGGAEDFVFHPDGGWNDTDLFGGLKNMMPGDRRTESIAVKNNANDYDYVKIYLRAEPDNHANESSNGSSSDSSSAPTSEFLSQLTLNVYQDGNLISTSSAAESGGLKDNVLLGSFYSGDETMLVVEVLAPENLSNRFANSTGEIEWFLTAEAYIDDIIIPPNTGSLTTTDINGATTTTIIAITLILAIIFALCYHRYTARFTNKH